MKIQVFGDVTQCHWYIVDWHLRGLRRTVWPSR